MNSTFCSTWKGVICDGTGRVTGLDLRDLGLNGTITPMIGNLVHLSFLNLKASKLWGPVPAEFMRCQNLSFVDLSLELLMLSFNKFSGSLPEVEGDVCRSLTQLRIYYNNIFGAIPSSLSRCQNLTILSLRSNRRIGSVPAYLGELQQLQALSLNNNKLTGSIPPSLGNCSSLTVLLLGSNDSRYNDLSGSIPEEFGNLIHLIELGLEYNWNLTGPVPGFLSRCWNLQILFLGACSFTSIAPEIWGMQKLVQIALFSNKLTGELPLEVGNCTARVVGSWLVFQQNDRLHSAYFGVAAKP